MVYLMSYWSVSSQVLTEEAEKLWLEVEIINRHKNLFLVRGWWKEILFKSTDCWVNTSLWLKLANDKQLTYDILERNKLPCAGTLYLEKEEFVWWFKEVVLYYPLVVKPLDGAHGDGVMMNIQNFDELQKKLKIWFETYDTLIIQEQIAWDEFRVLVFQWEVLLVLQRVPPYVIGDGKSSVKELIDKENNTNPRRGNEYESVLSYIKQDEELMSYIQKQWYTLDSRLEEWEKLQLRWNSNIWSGWTILDMTHKVHEDIKHICIQATHSLWLWMAGIDILTTDITQPLQRTWWVILEIWATPGLWWYREFTSVNPAKEILKRLFF